MDWLITLLAGMQFWHWLALGLVLLAAELATGSTYLLWPAVAAWIVGLVAMIAPVGWAAELTIFATLVILLTVFARPLLKPFLLAGPAAPLNEPSADLVGARGVATAAFVDGVGRVRLGDSEWRAQADEAISAQEAVEVVSVDGATLRVRRRS